MFWKEEREENNSAPQSRRWAFDLSGIPFQGAAASSSCVPVIAALKHHSVWDSSDMWPFALCSMKTGRAGVRFFLGVRVSSLGCMPMESAGRAEETSAVEKWGKPDERNEEVSGVWWKKKTYRQSPSGGFHDDSDITEGAVWVMSGKMFRGGARRGVWDQDVSAHSQREVSVWKGRCFTFVSICLCGFTRSLVTHCCRATAAMATMLQKQAACVAKQRVEKTMASLASHVILTCVYSN